MEREKPPRNKDTVDAYTLQSAVRSGGTWRAAGRSVAEASAEKLSHFNSPPPTCPLPSLPVFLIYCQCCVIKKSSPCILNTPPPTHAPPPSVYYCVFIAVVHVSDVIVNDGKTCSFLSPRFLLPRCKTWIKSILFCSKEKHIYYVELILWVLYLCVRSRAVALNSSFIPATVTLP